jgi:RNA polymerase sigma factor (sigma-70 family)
MRPNPEKRDCDDMWHSFKNGNKAAFATIYNEQVKSLLNYGYKVTSDRALIEDSIQDLFFELWQNRERLSETTSIKFYLFQALRYKICRNIKLNEVVEFQDIDKQPDCIDYMSHESWLIGVEVQSMQMQHLKNLIDRLPKRQQEAINLRYYHDFSNEEIAQIMGVNYQSACKFIYSALKKLKLNLQVSVTSLLFFLFFSNLMD